MTLYFRAFNRLTHMKWTAILALVTGILSSFPSNAQEAPIRLVTRTSTTYFTDGTAQGRSTTFFEVEGAPGEQPLGFMGRRLEEHLNPNPVVQEKFKKTGTFPSPVRASPSPSP